MSLITILLACLLSCIGAAINSYIALTTSLGPWIETTIVLASLLIFYTLRYRLSLTARTEAIGLTTAAAGIGGIIATACGFSFPTLFFIDKQAFLNLTTHPIQFIALLSGLIIAAGSLGLFLATLFEQALLTTEAFPFPIGELTYKMISIQGTIRKAYSLAIGFISTIFFLIIRNVTGFMSYITLLQKQTLSITTVPRISFQTDLLPMYWAIGFVTGHIIAVPLLFGLLSTIFVIEPLHYFYPKLTALIALNKESLSLRDFTIAFSSGIVVYGAASGFMELPRLLHSFINKFRNYKNQATQSIPLVLALSTLLINLCFLIALKFSFISILYLILFTVVCTYQMMLIAGKIGLAPLGRFATFVMVPGMFLFNYTPLQVTLVATYVEIAGGAACDALFGRKMAQLASISSLKVQRYQWLGLLVSALAISIIFWLLINHFGIGNEPGTLPVSRAVGRALLINVKSFDLVVLCLGILFGYLIRFTKINSALMLGGILMPADVSLMLIAGGLSTYLVKDKEEYYPFWSGVFAANSLWMLLKAFF